MKRLLLALWLVPALAVAQLADVDKLVTDTMKVWQGPRLALAIGQNDRVGYAQGFGGRGLGQGDAGTPGTPFGSAYKYQTIMSALAGEVVSSAAKTPWETFVRSNIFEPLGMKNTRVSMADWNASVHATGYRYDHINNRVILEPMTDYSSIAPAGTIKSSVRDMAQWLRFQLAGGSIDGKRLLSAEALQETRTPQMIIRLEGATR